MRGFVRLMAVVVTAAVFVVACSKDKDSGKITLDSPAVFFAQAGGSATVGFTAQNIKTLSATSKPTGWDEAVVDLAGATISVKAPSAEDIESGDAVKTGSFSFTGYTPGGTLVSATLFAGIVTTKDISAEVANSYIVTEPETNYLIDATRKSDGSQLATSYVDVVWQTASGFVQYADFEDGKASFYIGADSDDATKIKQGNAVIGAYDADGELIWSWHIWATDYDPDAEGGTVDFNGYTLMNRNLGALANDNSTTDKILASYGLYYQWGRKDPFTSAGTFTIINEDYSYQVDGERPIYNILNEELPKMRTRAEYHGTIAKSLRNPAVFYAMTYNFTGETDEYGQEIVLNDYRTKDWTDVSNDDYWGGVSGKKTIYDPCPVGYKVPTCDKDGNTPYAWLVYADMTWDDTNHGATQNGQWFPAAGTRVYASGGLDHQELNPYGGMWIGTAGKASANIEEYPELYGQYMFIVNGKRTFKVSKDARSQGMSMRCVKE